MDEMLSIALWIMVIFMTISATVTWFGTQPDMPTGLGLTGFSGSSIDVNAYQSSSCTMTSSATPLDYAWCFVGKITEPVSQLVNGIWNLLTGWTNLLHAIFVGVPAGDLFEGILIPFLSIIEIGAVLIILMRVASIIRGGGF